MKINIKPYWIVLAFLVSFCINVIILLDGCKNVSNSEPAPIKQIEEPQLYIEGNIIQLYVGNNISFVVYSNNVCEVYKTGINECFLTKWDNSYIIQYNLIEMY